MPKRPCAGNCGALVLKGYCPKCQSRSPRKVAEKHRTATRDKRVKSWYDSVAWQRARVGYFAKHPFCAAMVWDKEAKMWMPAHGAVLVLATDLDHIYPHAGDYEEFWRRSNWQGLCHQCHSLKTAKEDGGFGHVRKAAPGGASEDVG